MTTETVEMAETSTAERHEFQAETQALLRLVINSLYTHREVFLRELISNASDALDKARIRALTEHDLLGDDKEFEVVITPDAEGKTLTISDNGIGMTREELAKQLGTIAHSGSKAFIEQLTGDATQDAKLIGQFGVGFYSAFLVADRVRVVSRAARAEEAWAWESEADGSFTIEPAERGRRGTDVTLHLREDQADYLEGWRLRELVTRYSDFVGHPIKLVEEKTEGEGDDAETVKSTDTINRGKALWTQPKPEITEDQYKEFYKAVAHDWDEPLAWSHFQIEGTQMFTGLIYLPKRPPFDLFMDAKSRRGLRLYVQRVFVMDECDALLPDYLRFVRGIVDSDDLPLNVSREILQKDRVVESIKKAVTKKALELIEELATERPEDYRSFWEGFGNVLKEGLQSDFSNRERLAKLLRFDSSADEGLTSLADYVGRMKEGQEKIYYITGPDRDFVAKSPHLEGLKAKGYEVLYFVDPIDEWVGESLPEFEDKKLVSAVKGELDLDGEEDEAKKKAKEEAEGELARLIQAFKDQLGERVKEVRVTDRLTDSPACLVAGAHDMSANLERLLKAHNRAVPGGGKRVLELNPEHPLIQNLNRLAGDDAHRVQLNEHVETIFDQALLTEGSHIQDPAGFAQRMTKLLLEASQRELGE